MAVLGYSYQDAAATTPAQLSRALWWHAYYERAHWERMRILAFCALSPHAKKGRLKAPSDVMPFPWDSENSPTPRTPEEIRAEIQRIKEFWNTQDSKANVSIRS